MRAFRRTAAPTTRQRWGTAAATTADGVEARLEVAYVVRSDDAGVDHDVQDRIEDLVRALITSSRVSELPVRGDRPALPVESFGPHVHVEHLVVTISDVVVSPELRRLTTAHPAPWT